MELRKIIYIVVAILLVYFLYMYFFYSNEVLLVDTHDAKVKATITPSEFTKDNTVSDFTYSLWFYVKDWNYNFGKTKHIFSRVDSIQQPTPLVAFAPTINNLVITMNCSPVEGTTNNTANLNTCIVNNIPLQRWTHLLLSLNGRALDVYIDGKLVKTCVLNGVPQVSTSPMTLCGTTDGNNESGFSGYIARFKYFNKSMNPTEAYNIYKEGISGNPLFDALNKYSLKMSIIENNQEVKSFKI